MLAGGARAPAPAPRSAAAATTPLAALRVATASIATARSSVLESITSTTRSSGTSSDESSAGGRRARGGGPLVAGAPDGSASRGARRQLAARSRASTTRSVSGRNSVNVLPSPGVDSTGSRRRAGGRSRGRSTGRGRCRRTCGDVVPSACWKASKISRQLVVGDADAGVGDRERDDVLGCAQCVCRSRTRGLRADRERHAAVVGELERVGEQVLQDLRSRCSSVTIDGGSAVVELDRERRGPSARPPAGRRARRILADVAKRDRRRCRRSILPASTLDRSRMSLISDSRSLPAEWIVSANSTCWSVRLPSSFSASSRERISSEFSGVRSSCDMFARNSDLYFEDSASCAAFSSRPAARELDLARS